MQGNLYLNTYLTKKSTRIEILEKADQRNPVVPGCEGFT